MDPRYPSTSPATPKRLYGDGVKGRLSVLLVSVLALAACGGKSKADTFREVYEHRYTGGSSLGDQPPELTDEQIEEIVRRVCDAGSDGLDEADKIAENLSGRINSALGSSIAWAAEEASCPRNGRSYWEDGPGSRSEGERDP